MQKSKSKLSTFSALGTAALSAVSLKLCCWGPSLLAGIAGISSGSVYFSWLHSIRPYLWVLAGISLGFAFYQAYKPQKQEEGHCENCTTEKKPFFKSKLYVWIVAIFVVVIFIFYY